ncbi:MAG: hypothetical protein DCC63_06685 [Nitrospira sp.]|nr:MAG: hypothetical protein DCC63_06685 [Nitrospira sp.]
MTEEKANSWEDFERLILEKDTLRNEMRKRASPLSVSELLYRGQADAAWCLETTLDRTVSNTISLGEYYSITQEAKPRIETFTDKE